MLFRKTQGLFLVLLVSLAACREEAPVAPPPPAPLTQDATGYFCNMTMVEHHGPKGQIWLKRNTGPLWFSSVRDTVAFTLLPEEPRDIQAIYVTDMSGAGSWDNPLVNKWIDAHTAYFVIGSSKKGGMGTAEPVPFGSRSAAGDFSERFGGDVVTFDMIPENRILGSDDPGEPIQNKDLNQ